MKIDRLIAMILILLEREVVSASALARRLEVSRRTIYRDIDTLTMAGLPVFTTHGKAGGVGLMKAYKVDKKLLTPGDISLLTAGLDSYRQLYGRREFAHVLEKLRSIARDGGQSRPESKFAVDLSPSPGNQSLRGHLSVIETAINEGRFLAFGYIDKDGRTTSRTTEPYRVVFKESSWYLQAYCVERADYRIFKLARMNGPRALPETFAPRDFTPLAMDGGEWMERERVEVTVRLALSAKDKVIERYGEGNIVSEEEGICVARFPIANNEAGYDTLLRFGDKCELVGPANVRAAFRDYVRKILAKYGEGE